MTDPTKEDVARLREMASNHESAAINYGYSADDKDNGFAIQAKVLRRAADAIERLASVEAERDRLKADISSVVAAAESAGWNGVENSKILSHYVLELGEERDRLRDAVKVLRDCMRKFEIGGFESARLANAKADAILGKEGTGE